MNYQDAFKTKKIYDALIGNPFNHLNNFAPITQVIVASKEHLPNIIIDIFAKEMTNEAALLQFRFNADLDVFIIKYDENKAIITHSAADSYFNLTRHPIIDSGVKK